MQYTFTDTDILQDLSLSDAEHQLLYGLFDCCQQFAEEWENGTYNVVANIFIEYPEPLLRLAKIKTLSHCLEICREEIGKLDSKYKNHTLMFYVPFLDGEPVLTKRIHDCFTYAIGLMNILKENPDINLDVHSCPPIEYPIDCIYDLLSDFQGKFLNNAKEYRARIAGDGSNDENMYQHWAEQAEDAYFAIEWELYKRGLWKYDYNDLPDESYSDLYQRLFLKNRTNGIMEDAKQFDVIENPKELSLKVKTGVVRYMLESAGVKKIWKCVERLSTLPCGTERSHILSRQIQTIRYIAISITICSSLKYLLRLKEYYKNMELTLQLD